MSTLKTISIMLVMALSITMVKAKPANNIDKITGDYLNIKNALAANNGAKAQNSARELYATLSAKPAEGLNAGQQKQLISYLDKLKSDSKCIGETTTVESQRAHFASLSKNMLDVLKGLKTNASPLYVQYCPMKKAYWLSETAAIKNPYYGDNEMATCGVVKETLTPAK